MLSTLNLFNSCIVALQDVQNLVFFKSFQPMTSTFDDSALSLDKVINRFLV